MLQFCSLTGLQACLFPAVASKRTWQGRPEACACAEREDLSQYPNSYLQYLTCRIAQQGGPNLGQQSQKKILA